MDGDDLKETWALVTGASSGIGKEFASQLAQQGFNLVLVARREDILTRIAQELTTKYQIKAIGIKSDLATVGAAIKLRDQLKERNIRIRILCNNAAVGHYGRFEDLEVGEYENMVRVNIESVVALSRIFLEDLLSFPSSVMINIASQASFNPIPYMACYAASKAFIYNFSLALYGEYKNRGLLVQTLIPKPTTTEFDQKAGAPPGLGKRGSALEIVKLSLKHLQSKQPVVTNANGILLQKILANFLPVGFFITQVEQKFAPKPGSKG